MNRPLIIAHRGASMAAPENTMAAFHEAIAAGADGIEFDVRLTRDAVPVVIHDSSLKRTTGLPHRIADLSRAELERIGETVPSLEQLFTLFDGNSLGLYLEMKCDAASEEMPLAEACCRLINQHSVKQRVFIECFQLAALKLVKNIDPEIKTAPLFHISTKSEESAISQAIAIGASAVALHYTLARESLVQKAREAGLRTAVWTVDDPAWVHRARLIGIDALITNDPAAMLAHR